LQYLLFFYFFAAENAKIREKADPLMKVGWKTIFVKKIANIIKIQLARQKNFAFLIFFFAAISFFLQKN